MRATLVHHDSREEFDAGYYDDNEEREQISNSRYMRD
jgi:hypothetical protein